MTDDVAAIIALKYRYLRTLDTKKWDEFKDTLCEDIVANYGSHAGDRELKFTGRDEVVDYMSGAMGPWLTSVHSCTHPEIEVNGDEAKGSWLLQDVVLIPSKKLEIRGASYYFDTYRRVNGEWKISGTGYERVYETLTSYEGNAGYTILANMWDEKA